MKSPNLKLHLIATIKSVHRFLFIILFLFFNTNAFSQLSSFPTAYGAGAFATGGRGGTVLHVTSLLDDGSVGTLRWAMNQNYPRIIVFDVSGVINLQSRLGGYGNVTIAGQTAPEGGITIDGNALWLSDKENIIIRYVKFRGGNDGWFNTQQTLPNKWSLVLDEVNNTIVDHCSFSYAKDICASLGGDSYTTNQTVQNCLFTEAKNGILIGTSSNTNTPWGSVSILNNVFSNVGWRFPKGGGAGTYDVINNFVHNWRNRLIRMDADAYKLNLIGNHYQPGYNTSATSDNPDIIFTAYMAAGITPEIWDEDTYIGSRGGYDFTPDGYPADPSAAWSHFYGSDDIPLSWFASSRLPLQGRAPTILSSSSLKTELFSDVGACKYLNADGSVGYFRDSLDEQGISYAQTQSDEPVLHDSQYGDLPVLPQGVSYSSRPAGYYNTNDHIPETWGQANVTGFGADSHNDLAPSGYTWLEEFLNQVDYQSSGNEQVNAGLDISICEGSSATLVASGSQSYIWNTGETTQSINVSPTETTTYNVNGTDIDGNETSDSVTVTVNPLPTANAGEDQEICEGESITLTANGGDSFSWSTGETTQNITINPQQTTNYAVTVTSNGCSAIDEVLVTVKPRPLVNAGNDVDIYQNESITLSANGDGDFVWSTGGTTQTITVSPAETTTYTVTATLNGCINSDSVTVTVLEPDQVTADAGTDRTICENESVVLTATGGLYYLWSTGETAQSITVSPSVTTIYTVTVSNDYVSDEDSVVVNVNPLPIASAGNDRNILHGDEITLTASGGSEFLWSTGDTTQEITVEPTETTTYTVEVTENGCSSVAEVTVIVGVSASVNGEPIICQGQSTTIYAAGGSYYLWSTGETTQAITVSPTQTTTYSVVVSNNSSSDETEFTVNVNLNPVANAGEDELIEEGQSVTLTAQGGNTYLWSTGETTQSISVSPSETTTYTVETFVNGCSNSDDVIVSVVEQVNANAGQDIEICLGEQATLTASGGTIYNWDTGEDSQTITVEPVQTTTYTVSVSNGISTQNAQVTVNVSDCQAINNLPQSSEFDFKVYPNPTPGQVQVKLSGLQNISSIYITDATGNIISSESFEPNNGLIITKHYNFSTLSRGIYFITFKQSGQNAITKKLILN